MADQIQAKRLSAAEREALLRLFFGIQGFLELPETTLYQRVALIPYGKRDMKMLAAVADKLLLALAKTIPVEQQESMKRSMETATFTVGVKKPWQRQERNVDDYGLWVSFRQIHALADGCHDHCMTCDLDGQERRKCPLRKALDGIPNDVPDRPDGDCQYYTYI